MRVLIKNKNNFNTIELNNVTNIAFSSGNYVITAGGTNYTYSATTYLVNILYA